MKTEKEIHPLTGSDLTNFIFAGNATFTVVNETTGNRFTFRVRKLVGVLLHIMKNLAFSMFLF